MELTAEAIGAAVVGAIVVIVAVSNYLRNLSRPTGPDPLVSAIGMGWNSREQAEAFLAVLKRIADAAEKIASMQQNDIEQKMDGLLRQLQQTERSNAQRADRAHDDR